MHTKFPRYWLGAAIATSLFVTVVSAEQFNWAGETGTIPQGDIGQQGARAQQGGRGGGRGGQQGRDNTQVPEVTGTAMILGQVVSGDTGTPVRRARVALTGQEVRRQKTTMTDDEGRFVFTLLPAGRYSVNASKAGYVAIAYGAKAPGRAGTAIQLMDSQKIEVKAISLPKGGVVTGIVMDDYGEPTPGTPVRAMRQVIRTGERSLQSAGTDTTDDRGMYRIYGLQPGNYIVYAQPRTQGVGGLQTSIAAEIEAAVQEMTQTMGAGATTLGGRAGGRATQLGSLLGQLGGGRGQPALEQLQQQLNADGQATAAYAPVFYPGSTSPSQAMSVEITAGQERFGVDFQLQLTQTAQVDGTVIGPDGTVPPGTQITLAPKDSLPGLPGARLTARAGQDGSFTFRNVIPGEYSAIARAQIRIVDPNQEAAASAAAQGGRGGRGARGRGGAPTEILWALADVSVNGNNQSGVALQLQNGMTIAGRIVFDGQTLLPPTDLTRMRIALATVGAQDATFRGNLSAAMVDASGRFTFKGVPPGRYTLRGSAAAGGGGRGVGVGGAPQAGGSGSWRLASAMTGGRDSLDFPLEIGPGSNISDVVLTFTDRSAELNGTLQDATGAATSDYSVIVFPFDKQYWQPQSRRIQSVRPGTDGRFSVSNLPAGSYMIVAVTDVEPGEWYDPEFLEQLAAVAMRLTLSDGETKTQDIRIAGGG